jgi:hypothetical protein
MGRGKEPRSIGGARTGRRPRPRKPCSYFSVPHFSA